MKKIIVFLTIFVFTALLTAMAASDPVAAVIAGILASALYALFFEEGFTNFKVWLNIPIKASKLTIFLYGRGGSGKTSFIKSILELDKIDYIPSTKNVQYSEGILYYNPNFNRNRRFNKKYIVPISIADYKGQTPKEALSFKKNFNAQINALIFIVDIIHPDPKSENRFFSDNELITWLSSDTENKIEDRITQHIAYVGDAMLSIIFEEILSFNKNKLNSVRLVINKVDIVQTLISKGYISLSPGINSAEDYLKDKFRYIEKYIVSACQQNRINDVKVELVSFKKGTGVKELIRGLVETHFNKLGIR